MEKVKVKRVTTKYNEYTFYCDGCGQELGTSVEYDDGYVDRIGAFEKSFYIDGMCSYKIRKIFCDKCREEYLNKIVSFLESIGFKRDGG